VSQEGTQRVISLLDYTLARTAACRRAGNRNADGRRLAKPRTEEPLCGAANGFNDGFGEAIKLGNHGSGSC